MSVYKIFIVFVFNRECRNFFFGQSFLCVTFTSWSTPSFGMLLSKLSNRNTHVCTSSIRMISFFLPFSVNCSQVAMFQIMPALSPHGQGEGVVNLMWTGLDRGRGVPKIPKFVRTSFMDDPHVCWLSTVITISVVDILLDLNLEFRVSNK